MAHVEQLGDVVGRWYFQLAAIWCWYLPLCNYIKDFLFFLLLCQSIPFGIFLGSINLMEWQMIPASPSLMCYFNRGSIEGTNSSKNVFDARVRMVCFTLNVSVGIAVLSF